MNWKEIFKPNKWKIILTFLLLIIGIPLGLSTLQICKGPCPPLLIYKQIIQIITFLPAFLLSKLTGRDFLYNPGYILTFSTIYYYVVSSIIVNFYSKPRK